MQLGTRWSVGATPPARLPEELVAAIAEIERGLPADTTLRWTLTWLEGRPIAELDDGTTLDYGPSTREVVVSRGPSARADGSGRP
jgi:hypothetical protein